MKSVPPAERVMAPRVSSSALVPLLVRTISEAPVPIVVEAKACVLTPPAARRRRPLPLPTLASWTSESWMPTRGAETPPMIRVETGLIRFVVRVRAVVVVEPLGV